MTHPRPRRRLALAAMLSVALCGAAGCSGEPAAASSQAARADGTQPSTLREVARGEQSNVDVSKQAVARTQSQWSTLWKEHEWERPAPAVDFSREMAVAVFLGSQPTAGVGVEITEASPQADGLTIRYRVRRPAGGQAAAQVLTFPYHIVAVPLHGGPYTFERVD